MDKIVINSAFWILGRKDGLLRLCSHRKVGHLPKYKIVPAIDGRAVFDILSEELNEEEQILAFAPVDKGDAISEAMGFAERYEPVHSKS
jgi:hypothetical protein